MHIVEIRPAKIEKRITITIVTFLIILGFIRFQQIYLSPYGPNHFVNYDPVFGDNGVEIAVLISACSLPPLVVSAFYQKWREEKTKNAKLVFYFATVITLIIVTMSAILG